MAKEESGFRVIIVLVLIAMCSAVLLAYVNKVTTGPIEINKKAETKKAIGIVLHGIKDYKFSENPAETQIDGSKAKYFKAVNEDSVVLGYAIIVKGPNGFTNDFDMMVGIDSSGTILDTYVLDHKETPGLGDGMTKPLFKEQFSGRTLQNTKWRVKKDGGDVDAITAATITSRAFTAGVERALRIFKTVKEEQE
ncbi:MAG: RnfABCDGE type electron transport complex subunit G [Calditrichaceae bacterium]